MTKRTALHIALFLGICSAACSTEVLTPSLESDGEIQLRPGLTRMVVGETEVLHVVAFDKNGLPVAPGEPVFSSLDTAIARVSGDGEVTGIAGGWARIVVHSVSTGKEDTAVVGVGVQLQSIFAGDDTGCGLTADGRAYCWGGFTNPARNGILGTGVEPTSFTPAPLAGGLHFSALSIAQDFACGLVSGAPYCWGYATSNAVLGITTCKARINFGCHTPEKVGTALSFTHIAVSQTSVAQSACASGPSTGLYCWGKGQLVRPGTNCFACNPQQVSAALTGAISLGSSHGCALDGGGHAYCWGGNAHGELGVTTIPSQLCISAVDCTASSAPIPVATNVVFSDLTGGSHYTCGLTRDGAAYCWGAYPRYAGTSVNDSREPGLIPVQVGGALRFRSIKGGAGSACGVTPDDKLYCWGDASWSGAYGEPRLAYSITVSVPTAVMAGISVIAAASTGTATCAITREHVAMCLGSRSGTGQGAYSIDTSIPLPIAPPGPIPGWLHTDWYY